MTPLVILLSVFGAALAAAVILLRRAIAAVRAEQAEDEAQEWGEFWASVAAVFDDQDEPAGWADYWEQHAQQLDQPVDQSALQRAIHRHPAGRKRR